MVAIVIFIIGGILGIIYRHEKGIIFKEIEQRAFDITTVLAFNSVQAVLLDDYLVLQNLVDSISNRRSVIEAVVINNQGVVLVHNHTGERGKKYTDPKSIQAIRSTTPLISATTYKTRRILDVAVPVIISSQRKATARILFSLEEAYAAVQKIAYNISLIGILGILISILLAFFISKIVTHPMLGLLEATKKISQGHRDIQIEIQSYDEIGELAIAFNKMVKDISTLEKNIRQSEQLTAIGLAAASLAHKIKTPLTSIRTFIEMFPERYSDAQFREALQHHVLLQVDHLDKIISGLSKFSKERVLSPSRIDINYIIVNIKNILQERIQKSNIQITIQKEELPLIWADKEQLAEALLVIGENALEAMEDKGGLHIQTGLVKEDSSDTGDRYRKKVKITFTDTGSGIAPENLERIFEPFVSTKSKGMGLGLAICAKIIKKHNGTIQVKSEINKGTTFEIFLPVDEA